MKKRPRRRDLHKLEKERRTARVTGYEAKARLEELVEDKAKSDRLARTSSSRLRILSESGVHERPIVNTAEKVVFGHIKQEVPRRERILVTTLLVFLSTANLAVLYLLFFR